jgi:hypothetical protein
MAVVAISFDAGAGHVLRDLKTGTLEIVEGVNGRSSLRCQIISVDGSYQPDVDQEVTVTIDSALAFRGVVVDTEVEYIALGNGLITTVDAADYSCLAERRVIRASTPGGVTGRTAIDYIVDNYLADYGVTRDPGMPEGGDIGALSYHYAKATEVLDDVVRIASAPQGWLWRIDEDKVLTAFLPSLSAWPCPFTVETADPNLVGDIRISKLRAEYANRVFLTTGIGIEVDGIEQVITMMSEDAGSIANRGIYETAISTPGPMLADAAQQVADGYLRKLVKEPTQIQFSTMTGGARAGQTVDIDLPARGVSGEFLITELQARDLDGKNVLYNVTAVDGGGAAYSWKDTYIFWAEQGSKQGGAGFAAPVTTTSIAFDAATDLGVVTATSLTASHTCSGSNRILWLSVVGDNVNDYITGATYDGVAMDLVQKRAPGDSNNAWLYQFVLTAPATGANNVVITGSSSGIITAVAVSYTGAAQSGQPDNFSQSQSSVIQQTYSSAITPTVNGCWVVCAWNAYAFGNAPSAGTATTLRQVGAFGNAVAFFDSNGAVTPAAPRSLETTYVGAFNRTHMHLLATMAPAVVVG